jgi:DNA-binding NarL/FixJ family response regulator
MTVHVAVVGNLPMYTRGLAGTLGDHGHPADVPADILDWSRRPGRLVVFLILTREDDWGVLAALIKLRADAAVVAVIADPGLREVVRAVDAGAVGIMALDAEPAAVDETLRATLRGNSILPAAVLRSLVAGAAGAERPVTETEIRWLRELAAGTTVARLAEQADYSERMMFRLLAGVYTRLGAGNRTEALMHAREEGWL